MRRDSKVAEGDQALNVKKEGAKADGKGQQKQKDKEVKDVAAGRRKGNDLPSASATPSRPTRAAAPRAGSLKDTYTSPGVSSKQSKQAAHGTNAHESFWSCDSQSPNRF